jgi:hypothetical protein
MSFEKSILGSTLSDVDALKKKRKHTTDHVSSPGCKMKKVSKKCAPFLMNAYSSFADCDWRVVIADPQIFRTKIRIMSSVLVQSHFYLDASENFSGLCIEAMDPRKVCMIQAKFECVVETDLSQDELDKQTFCIEMDTFNTLMQDIHPTHMLEILRVKGEADIVLLIYEATDKSDQITFRVKTMQETEQRLRMKKLVSPRGVDFDVSTLRNNCKTFRHIGATDVQLALLEAKHEGVTETYLSLMAEGHTVSASYCYLSEMTRDKEDTDSSDIIGEVSCIRVLTRGEQRISMSTLQEGIKFKKIYCEKFQCQYLNCLLKHMDKQRVHLSLSEKNPLVLLYTLGNNRSYIQAMLAQCIKTDSDTDCSGSESGHDDDLGQVSSEDAPQEEHN